MKNKRRFAMVSVSVIVVALILEAGILKYVNDANAYKLSKVLLDRVFTVLDKNDQSEEELIESLKDDYIVRAKAVSYIVDAKPQVENDVEELQKIAKLMSVDEMICAAAACMTASFGEFGKVYRIGGDEFVVIVTQKPDELDAMTKHFDSSVAEWRGKIVDSMTISYGCVRSLEEDWELVHDIEKEADRRMYASKARYYSDSGIDRRK